MKKVKVAETEEFGEISSLSSLAKGLVPMSPGKGPPFPRMLGIRWPIIEYVEPGEFKRMQAVKSPHATGYYLFKASDREKVESIAEKKMGKGITYSIWSIDEEDIPEWQAEGYALIT